MKSPIQPTMGRIVLVHLGPELTAPAIVNGADEGTDVIDVLVCPRNSTPWPICGVEYDNSETPRDTTWHWMPYQLQKDEAKAEAKA